MYRYICQSHGVSRREQLLWRQLSTHEPEHMENIGVDCSIVLIHDLNEWRLQQLGRAHPLSTDALRGKTSSEISKYHHYVDSHKTPIWIGTGFLRHHAEDVSRLTATLTDHRIVVASHDHFNLAPNWMLLGPWTLQTSPSTEPSLEALNLV